MIDDDERAVSAIDNPFSSAAVAAIHPGDREPITVATSAIREISAYLTDYLAAPRPDEAGTTVAVIGNVGYGKTHALAHLLARANREARPDVHVVYLDAKTPTFTALCRSFLTQLDRDDVGRRLREV